MANTVTVGRLTFTSPGSLSFSGSTNQPNNSVNISGKLAVDDLDDAKSLRDKVANKMTPSQMEKAQDLARDCMKKNFKGC